MSFISGCLSALATFFYPDADSVPRPALCLKVDTITVADNTRPLAYPYQQVIRQPAADSLATTSLEIRNVPATLIRDNKIPVPIYDLRHVILINIYDPAKPEQMIQASDFPPRQLPDALKWLSSRAIPSRINDPEDDLL
ncbi:hypothetical protein [Chitinophaga nivalis]|uniref:Uncharacterized protein n=1 Tax=Chitinophaga nivalis TaxID=2991709 RepID=A0ABT3IQE1_9BACT|nr:hypothetical protein [Chitinophaga nivalis]MCW3464125.1 hypothetical protein [Chitinophaga nivalis]MCW3486185.1 hypothetical protein [Chitinophaga nivalis]